VLYAKKAVILLLGVPVDLVQCGLVELLIWHVGQNGRLNIAIKSKLVSCVIGDLLYQPHLETPSLDIAL
jgi:hypothetical protein